jgi:hypothetical protein
VHAAAAQGAGQPQQTHDCLRLVLLLLLLRLPLPLMLTRDPEQLWQPALLHPAVC